MIPETGGGLSGFIARGLWFLYSHFPSSGRWDWLLLFLAIGVSTHFLFMPYLWRAVKADMEILKTHAFVEGGSNQSVWAFLWGGSWMFFFIWFFSTPAGRTFVQGRPWVGDADAASRLIYWISLAVLMVASASIASIDMKVDERNKRMGVYRPTPYADRGLLSLYGGGGVFYQGTKLEGWGSVVLVEISLRLLAHFFYWYWSPASLWLMYCFLAGSVLADCCRMAFVAILHKETFG